MRVFAHFLLAIVGTLLLTSLVVGPLWLALQPVWPDIPFHKLASRLWQLSMVGGVAFIVWRLHLRGKQAWGYALPRPLFLRHLAIGIAVGVVTMTPVAVSVIGLGLRDWRPTLDGLRWVELFFSGALTGLAVGFLEETFYRGLLLGALVGGSGPASRVDAEATSRAHADRLSGPAHGLISARGIVLAVLASSMLYASLHFLARARIPAAEVDAFSGLALLAQSLRHFAAPATMMDSFLALTAVGSLLAMARLWTGSIALSIGLHAGWVWVMKIAVGTTWLDPDAPAATLVNPIDGFTGWLVLGWTLALTCGAWHWRARFAALRATN